MTTKNCANVAKLVLKDLCENSFVQNVLYSLSAVHIWVKSIIQISYSGLTDMYMQVSYTCSEVTKQMGWSSICTYLLTESICFVLSIIPIKCPL